MSQATNGTNGVLNGSGRAPLDASKLEITLSTDLRPLPEPSSLVFGDTKTDHMLIVEHDPETGWGIPRIQPYQPLQLDPASHCLHYSTNLIEGMKAYLGPDGTPLIFRPQLNAARMARSAARLALPTFDAEPFITLIKRLVMVEKRWIPEEPGYSLYIRPTLIGTRPALGLVVSDHATLFVVVSPGGPFFKQDESSPGVKPVSLYASYDYIRSWPGGTGEYKLGGNYAPCFMPQVKANEAGYQQILWLLEDMEPKEKDMLAANGSVEVEKKSSEMRITEAGQMNFFAVIKRSNGGKSTEIMKSHHPLTLLEDIDLVTPTLDGTVLPGVTRDSCLALARMHNLPSTETAYRSLPGIPSTTRVNPVERTITIEEVQRLNERGEVLEIFGAGTAAVVCPIGRVGYRHSDINFPEYPGGYGVITKALLETLQGIQVGTIKSDWSVRCE